MNRNADGFPVTSRDDRNRSSGGEDDFGGCGGLLPWAPRRHQSRARPRRSRTGGDRSPPTARHAGVAPITGITRLPERPGPTPFAHASPPSEPRRRIPRSTRALGAFAGAVPLLLLGALVVGMVASEVRAPLLADPATLVGPSTPSMTRVQTLQTTAALAPSLVLGSPRSRLARLRPRVRQLPSCSLAASPPGLARATPESEPSPGKSKPTPVIADRGAAGRSVPERAEVEARTLVALQQRVLFSVPAALINTRTGLLVNNVHVAVGAWNALRSSAAGSASAAPRPVAAHGRHCA